MERALGLERVPRLAERGPGGLRVLTVREGPRANKRLESGHGGTGRAGDLGKYLTCALREACTPQFPSKTCCLSAFSTQNIGLIICLGWYVGKAHLQFTIMFLSRKKKNRTACMTTIRTIGHVTQRLNSHVIPYS